MKFALLSKDQEVELFDDSKEAQDECKRLGSIVFEKKDFYYIEEWDEKKVEIFEWIYGDFTVSFTDEKGVEKALNKDYSLYELALKLDDKATKLMQEIFNDAHYFNSEWESVLEKSIIENTLCERVLDNFISSKKREFKSVLNYIKINDKYFNEKVVYVDYEYNKYKLSGEVKIRFDISYDIIDTASFDDSWRIDLSANDGDDTFELEEGGLLSIKEIMFLAKHYSIDLAIATKYIA